MQSATNGGRGLMMGCVGKVAESGLGDRSARLLSGGAVAMWVCRSRDPGDYWPCAKKSAVGRSAAMTFRLREQSLQPPDAMRCIRHRRRANRKRSTPWCARVGISCRGERAPSGR